jgi:hypothetical protein
MLHRALPIRTILVVMVSSVRFSDKVQLESSTSSGGIAKPDQAKPSQAMVAGQKGRLTRLVRLHPHIQNGLETGLRSQGYHTMYTIQHLLPTT